MVRVIFMGSPAFAVLPLEYLALSQYRPVAVYAQPDRPVGRGRVPAAPPVKKRALELGLSVVQPASLKEPAAVAELAGLRPDIIVVAAFGQLLPGSVLAIPRCGCLNIHPSLLPRFRGASPVAAAVLAGDEFTGVSIMRLDEGMDTGPVLAQAQLPVSGRDTTGLLSDKLARIGAQLLLEILPRWLKGEITPRPQAEARASYCRPIAAGDGEIDWRLPAVDIWRRVRAYSPWPGSFTAWQGRRLKIIGAVPLSGEEETTEGRVVALSPTGESEAPTFGVGTGRGVLGITKLQLEGKRVVVAGDFLRGQRGFIGAQLD